MIRKDNTLYVNCKGYDNLFNCWITIKDMEQK